MCRHVFVCVCYYAVANDNPDEKKFCAMVSGSRGLYNRGENVDTLTSSISAMGLDLPRGRSVGKDSNANTSSEHDSGDDLVNSEDKDDPSHDVV
ncbi:hypothetical protein ACLOJK_012465 [Asimina triloba]